MSVIGLLRLDRGGGGCWHDGLADDARHRVDDRGPLLGCQVLPDLRVGTGIVQKIQLLGHTDAPLRASTARDCAVMPSRLEESINDGAQVQQLIHRGERSGLRMLAHLAVMSMCPSQDG